MRSLRCSLPARPVICRSRMRGSAESSTWAVRRSPTMSASWNGCADVHRPIKSAASVCLFRHSQKEDLGGGGYYRKAHDARLKSVDTLRRVSRSKPDEKPDSDHKEDHSP